MLLEVPTSTDVLAYANVIRLYPLIPNAVKQHFDHLFCVPAHLSVLLYTAEITWHTSAWLTTPETLPCTRFLAYVGASCALVIHTWGLILSRDLWLTIHQPYEDGRYILCRRYIRTHCTHSQVSDLVVGRVLKEYVTSRRSPHHQSTSK